MPTQETTREKARETARETTQGRGFLTSDFLSQSGPAELVLLILKACKSTHDVLAFTATCRHLHHVGRCYAVERVASSGSLREIPCFREALTAARMTQVVADAERRGELPSVGLSPADLACSGCDATPPSMSDLMAAFALSRLAEALERRILLLVQPAPPPDRVTAHWGYEQLPEQPERMPEFSARIRRAIYRALIIGAALAGVYNEPMFRAKTAAPDLGLSEAREIGELSRRQLEYLRQFAVCRVDYDAEGDEVAFGRIGRWLLENILSDDERRMAMARRFQEGSGRARYCQSRNGDCPAALVNGGTHSDAHLVVWEVLQVLWVQDHIHRTVLRPGSPGFTPPISSTDDDDYREKENFPGREIRAFAVLLGIFNTEGIRVPDASWTDDGSMLRAFVGDAPAEEAARYFLEDGHAAKGRSVAVFFNRIQEHSERSNDTAVSSDMTAQLRVKFFRYFLRRYLDLQLLSDVVEPCTGANCSKFLGTPTIFSHDDVQVPGRQAYEHSADLMLTDFLDGTEILVKAG